MKFKVIATDSFDKHLKKLAKKYPSLKKDISDLIDLLEFSPRQGVSLGNDYYKLRLAITSKGKGKSGGARVITCVKLVHETVFLVALYDKSEQENISDEKLDALLGIADLI